MARRVALLFCVVLFGGIATTAAFRVLDLAEVFRPRDWAFLGSGMVIGALIAFGVSGSMTGVIRSVRAGRWFWGFYIFLGSGAFGMFLMEPRPLWLWALASGVTGCVSLGLIPLLFFSPDRGARFPVKEHVASVMDVRPDEGDDSFDAYLIARCECGWVGPTRDTPEIALEDASEHTPMVKTEIERPLS